MQLWSFERKYLNNYFDIIENINLYISNKLRVLISVLSLFTNKIFQEKYFNEIFYEIIIYEIVSVVALDNKYKI